MVRFDLAIFRADPKPAAQVRANSVRELTYQFGPNV